MNFDELTSGWHPAGEDKDFPYPYLMYGGDNSAKAAFKNKADRDFTVMARAVFEMLLKLYKESINH